MPALRSPSLTTSDAVLSTRVRAITGATATTYSLKRHHISKGRCDGGGLQPNLPLGGAQGTEDGWLLSDMAPL